MQHYQPSPPDDKGQMQQQKLLQMAPIIKEKNPEAYDELKRRLLNEYKKLVSNKKVLEEQPP